MNNSNIFSEIEKLEQELISITCPNQKERILQKISNLEKQIKETKKVLL